jgi:hypothetical protein
MKPSTCSFRDAMNQSSCGMLSTPNSPSPKGKTVIVIMGADTMEHCGMGTEKGHNELFSVARKVIILLISFKLPQSQANRAVSPSLSNCQCQEQNTVQ